MSAKGRSLPARGRVRGTCRLLGSLALALVLTGCASQQGVAPEGRTAALDKARASLAIQAPTERGAERPLILVHYMPWFQAPPVAPGFGWHWHMGSTDPYEAGANGQRKIASHYYPLTGPYDSSDPALLEYQLLLMKMSGIDGVIVDWYGISRALDYAPLHAAAQKLFAAISRAGLLFAVCYEDQSIGNRVKAGDVTEAETADALRRDMAWADAFWFAEKAYLKLEGRPVVLDFGPIYVRDSRTWAGVLGGLDPRPLFVTLDGALPSTADAAFSWPPMYSSVKGVLGPDALVTYLNSFYALARPQRHVVAAAFPGFHDYYAQASVRQSYGYLDDYLGATLQLTLEAALRARSTLIQVATWNDYGEGTMVEPTLQNGYRDLETLQAMRRQQEPSFSFTRQDLRVPLQVWARRIAGGADASRLDALSAAILAGDMPAYRDLLRAQGIDPAAVSPVLAPVERALARPVEKAATSVPDPYANAANLARGGRVTANNHIYDFIAENAVDAEVRTYWEGAANAFPNEITVDLGAAHALAAMRLKLNPQRIWGARTQAFTVLGSTDGSRFDAIVPSAAYLFDPAANLNTVTVPLAATARFLRLSFTANDGATAAQVAEWEVFEK